MTNTPALPPSRGTTTELSLPRRFITDLLHASRGVPLVPMERRMNLTVLAEARRRAAPRIGWCAIFTKAYALVAARRHQLRQAYLSLPWGRLYEHPTSFASIAIEREFHGEMAAFFTLVHHPDTLSLKKVQQQIDHASKAPVEEVPAFRRLLRLTRYSWPIRRFVWWLGLSALGTSRAKNFGTFGVSITSQLGASQLALISPLTSTLHYGPISSSGEVDVRITFDHRVLDGGNVARALADLEEALLGELLSELQSLQSSRSVAPQRKRKPADLGWSVR